MFVIIDTETERLVNPQKLWLIVCKEVDSGKIHVFRNLHESPEVRERFARFARGVTGFIGHNLIGFDLQVLRRLALVDIDHQKVIDTLVVSRLLNAGVDGGHSLESIGDRLGCPKGKFNDFSALTEEMEKYCIQDCEVTYKYYKTVEPFIFSKNWKEPLRLEHDIAFVCEEMKANGFAFDIQKAKDLYTTITTKLQALDELLVGSFPPKTKLIKEVTPRETKHGTLHLADFRWLKGGDLTPYSPGHPFSRFEFVPFNPGSPKQIVERLNEAGWQPYEKTKGHIEAERERNNQKLDHYAVYGWKVSEANLATLPKDAPEAAHKLVERLLLDSRRSTLEEWFNAFSDHDKRIHGSFKHIGAWTHRMSHSGPNMANIPAGKSPYAHEMRSLWTVDKGNLLVGVDADGIQLRILAHYMDDPAFTKGIVSGRKEDGTDTHSLNQKALGTVCKSRDDAKTFIYAWLLGAGDLKISQILGCSLKQAKAARKNFLAAYPALKRLKEEIIPQDARRGYFIGLDGRAVLCDSEHLMLAGYLQNGEAIVMKKANLLWRKELTKAGIPFKQVNFVHDEWQVEIAGDYELAKKAAEIMADSIRIVGEQLKLRCPLAGSILNQHKEPAIGHNWSETH